MKRIFLYAVLMICTCNAMWSCKATVATRPETVVVARPAQPGPNYIWVEGDWYYSGGRYVQRPGTWVVPRNNRTWAPGRWEQSKHGWYWKKGHWR
ncbi:MAG TPA: hypothetical protein PKM63_19350 [Panacibacter sp.]|nr:hypothetical protein [Panacibacter sp.]HNP46460.1 hypothetical protein [Panacibacter sp.]